MKAPVTLSQFQSLDIRVGLVRRAEQFPEARTPALKLWIDFGDGIGERTSSARITRRYAPADLEGTAVLAVVNLPSLRIAGFRSEVLVLGVTNPRDPEDVLLVRPDPPGTELRGWPLG